MTLQQAINNISEYLVDEKIHFEELQLKGLDVSNHIYNSILVLNKPKRKQMDIKISDELLQLYLSKQITRKELSVKTGYTEVQIKNYLYRLK